MNSSLKSFVLRVELEVDPEIASLIRLNAGCGIPSLHGFTCSGALQMPLILSHSFCMKVETFFKSVSDDKSKEIAVVTR